MTDVGLGSLATASAIAPPRGHNTLRRLLRHRSFMFGFSVILVLTLAAVLAPLISPVDPSAMRVRLRFRPPSSQFWFGTDMFGRDIFTRVLYGARVSLFVGIAVCVVSGLCSAVIGVIAAQFRRLDGAIMRLMDALMSFPAILLALGIAAALGPARLQRHHCADSGLHPCRRSHRPRRGTDGARNGFRARRAGFGRVLAADRGAAHPAELLWSAARCI